MCKLLYTRVPTWIRKISKTSRQLLLSSKIRTFPNVSCVEPYIVIQDLTTFIELGQCLVRARFDLSRLHLTSQQYMDALKKFLQSVQPKPRTWSFFIDRNILIKPSSFYFFRPEQMLFEELLEILRPVKITSRFIPRRIPGSVTDITFISGDYTIEPSSFDLCLCCESFQVIALTNDPSHGNFSSYLSLGFQFIHLLRQRYYPHLKRLLLPLTIDNFKYCHHLMMFPSLQTVSLYIQRKEKEDVIYEYLQMNQETLPKEIIIYAIGVDMRQRILTNGRLIIL